MLREKAKEVPVSEIKSPWVKKIINKLGKVISENDEAIAAAAPQIGESWRIFVISKWILSQNPDKQKNEFKNMVFINPKSIKTSRKKAPFAEGCLSAAGQFGTVVRSEKVKIEAYNARGEKFSRGASGILAQAIQHELDHLDGVLFLDKAVKKD